jgi:hypothetical protein
MILGLGLKYRKHPNSPPMFWSPLVAGWELVASSMFWRATCQEGQSLCDMLCQQVFATWTRNQAVDNTGQIKTTIVEGLLLLPVFPFVKYEAVWSMFAPCCLFHPSGLDLKASNLQHSSKMETSMLSLHVATPCYNILAGFSLPCAVPGSSCSKGRCCSSLWWEFMLVIEMLVTSVFQPSWCNMPDRHNT